MTKSDTSSLLRFLFEEEPELAVPAECLDSLHAYIEIELAGENADVQYPQIQPCLQSDPVFYQLYEAAKEILMMEQENTLLDPPETAVVDEAFLESILTVEPTTKQYRMQWHLNQLGHLIVQLSSTFIDNTREGLAQFTDKPPAQPALILAGELRSSSEQLPQFSLKGAVEDIDVDIKLEQTQNDPSLCQITVNVDIPSREGWPNLADTTITIRRGETEVGQRMTDPYGTAIFTDIAVTDLDYLIFEIVPST